jgi:prepilin-type N-terminal cleavage/methylation domain-containing protein
MNKLPPNHLRTRRLGFTLVEVMVVVAIMGILGAMAAPMFQRYVARNEVNAEISAFASTLRLARSTALKQSLSVTVCPTDDAGAAAPQCSDGSSALGWASGWLVFSDLGVRGTVDATDTVIARQSAFHNSGGIIPTLAKYKITYSANGLAVGSSSSMVFQLKGDELNPDSQTRICINFQGESRTQTIGKACGA